ncbi:bifunctional demethylmenaquinone methyltransferase/2-methoxy-6-polyprenyl-1,4-benzoquinol methylase UbiE [Parafilimonas sp.]|uniref:bifunctional demethylmenaquinone methyltransferase/2-methoxy-6-polyprenyl-1,4-benzoquinol methylase UbiE n=1 Tax=Parafilimonas sp. TaxID=1969739 RepID=UPI0039E32CDB
MLIQPHDHIIPFGASKKTKKEQVAEMFDKIAGKYDFMNRFLSARTDIRWRKKAINALKKYQPQYILDIATGTGDMAIRAHKTLHPEHITGIDISSQMLAEGRKKIEKLGLSSKISLQKGDSENLPFSANRFDVVMAAFGVRNFENLEKGLTEMYRVLKDGGRLCIIEFSRPKPGFIKSIYQVYMSVVAPQIAKVFKQDKQAYQYLNRSANAFPERSDFTAILEKAGFKNTSYQPLTFGMCCIYYGSK